MKILSAIVLLLWTVCYGRCLAEQNGLLKDAGEAWRCDHACCDEKPGQTPPANDGTGCHVCDFISHGGAPTGEQFVMDAPVLLAVLAPFLDFVSVLVGMDNTGAEMVVVNNTGPPPLLRMCEWMASTATPVRGPNARA